MAKIRRTVKVELSDEERAILTKASQILHDLAEEDGASDLFEMIDNFDDELNFISRALFNLVTIDI